MTNVFVTVVEVRPPKLSELREPLMPATAILVSCFLLWWLVARKCRSSDANK
ncbi:MAG TPA: hypothetical protein VM680_02715 [Verrucomicrobiae bacterium]|nr:hypothetical protein [Verrucomicrobiae bacterium]